MKLVATLFVAFLLLTGCTKQATTVTPPTTGSSPVSPNANVIEALDTFGQVGCAIGAASVTSPAVVALLTGPCPTAVAAISDVILASGTLAKITASIAVLKAAAAAIPNLTANDQKYITLALALAQATENAYAQATGQTVSIGLPQVAAVESFSPVGFHNLVLTSTERLRLKQIKERAKALKAQHR